MKPGLDVTVMKRKSLRMNFYKDVANGLVLVSTRYLDFKNGFGTQ